MIFKRSDFMSERQQKKMKNAPRRHYLCKQRTGVMRPGKTACERAKREATK